MISGMFNIAKAMWQKGVVEPRRRQKELDPQTDTIFICKEGKRSILAINTLREAGYKGPLYNLKGGMDAMKDIIFSHEGGGL